MMVRSALLFTVAVVAALALTAGCEDPVAKPAEQATATGRPHMMKMPSGNDDICPMYVMNATVSHAEVKGGAAMTFTAPINMLDDLRRRVSAMADHYRAHAMKGPAHMAEMPETDVIVEETPDGARIVFKAKRPESVSSLRTHVQWHADRLDKGTCQMGR